jgi:hypothetical protein
MTPRSLRLHAPALATGVLLALLQLSCATTGMTPDPVSMPAARAGLRPQYRVFYDELVDYGDWILIEPYGFVFRPRTRFNSWSPYYDGFWSPSDNYGWVWVSAEPYGWATYHYGRWLNDDYQGWVWVPGLDWAPAWVAWSASDQYVGWAPLGPSNNPSVMPGGAGYHFVARSDLGSTDLRTRVLPAAQATQAAQQAQPVENLAEVDHVVVNRGPRIDWVEAAAGPLPRARVQDVNPMGRTTRPPETGASGSAPSPSTAPSNEFKRSAEAEARRARTIIQQKQSQPDVIQRFKAPPADTTPAEPKQKSAPAGKPIPATKPAPMSRDTLR